MAMFTVILRKFFTAFHKFAGRNRSFSEQRQETREVFENGRHVYEKQTAINKHC